MRKALLIAASLIIFSSPALADEIIDEFIPDAQKVGEARLSYYFWDIYDASLLAPRGIWNHNQPYALKIEYLRNMNSKKLAQSSAEEIRKQGFTDEIKLAKWYTQMKEIFPDVKNGSTITGIYLPNKETHFYNDEQKIGTIKDPEFGTWFFGIWLSEKTSRPEIRKNLIGQKQ